MCELAEYLEQLGIKKGRAEGRAEGRTEGILAMIRDNLEMGQEKETIIEKTVRFFSLTLESALEFYEIAIAE